MGRSPTGSKEGSLTALKKGAWTPEEDEKLIEHINQHGYGNWRALPKKCGLQRCGKSCRLRWTNYLRPDIKRGAFTPGEEQKIIQLHALVGNKWAFIASQLPKRTDNEIKNYWNTVLKKRFSQKIWWSSSSFSTSSPTTSSAVIPLTSTASESTARIPESISMLNQLIGIRNAATTTTNPSTTANISKPKYPAPEAGNLMNDQINSLGNLNLWVYNMQRTSATTSSTNIHHDKVKGIVAPSNGTNTNIANNGSSIATTTTTIGNSGSSCSCSSNGSGSSTTSHLAQWETARLEAEARLVQQSTNNSIVKPKPKPKPNPDLATEYNIMSAMASSKPGGGAAARGGILNDSQAAARFESTLRGFNLNLMNSALTPASPLPSQLASAADSRYDSDLTNPKYLDATRKLNGTATAANTLFNGPMLHHPKSAASHSCILNQKNVKNFCCSTSEQSPLSSPNGLYNNANVAASSSSHIDTPATSYISCSSGHEIQDHECMDQLTHPHPTLVNANISSMPRPSSSTNILTTLQHDVNEAHINKLPGNKLTTPITSGRLSWTRHDLSLPNLILPSSARVGQHLRQQLPQQSSPSSACLRRSYSSCAHINSDSYINLNNNINANANANASVPSTPTTAALSHGDLPARIKLETILSTRTRGDSVLDHDHHEPGNNMDSSNSDMSIINDKYASSFTSMMNMMSVDEIDVSPMSNTAADDDDNNDDNDNDPLDDICNILTLPSPKNMMMSSVSASSCNNSLAGGSDHNICAVTTTMVQALSFQQIETLMLGGEQPINHDTQFSNLLMDLNLC